MLATANHGATAAIASPEEIATALHKATIYLTSIATDGGYVWRYSSDLSIRKGEIPATSTEIWVQSPATPQAGEAFLASYAATDDPIHLTAATAAARALLRGQLRSGGWDYKIELAPADRANWSYRIDTMRRRSNVDNGTTFDDDTTQGALRFLMTYLEVAERNDLDTGSIREAIIYGLDGMLAAQYPNGAWPQRFTGKLAETPLDTSQVARLPRAAVRRWPDKNYTVYYTLNDNSQADCIRTLLMAWRLFSDERYLSAARRGGEFLIRAQLPEPQSGWAQQYNFAMEPAWARAFEPPAIASSESVGAAQALMDLYMVTGDEAFMAAVGRFATWINRSEVAPGIWARLYELGTNKPIYGDYDGRVHYALPEISQERREGYSWEAAFGVRNFLMRFDDLRSFGRDLFEVGESARRRNVAPTEFEIFSILRQQDEDGRWLNEDWIDTDTFVRNMKALSAYLVEP